MITILHCEEPNLTPCRTSWGLEYKSGERHGSPITLLIIKRYRRCQRYLQPWCTPERNVFHMERQMQEKKQRYVSFVAQNNDKGL